MRGFAAADGLALIDFDEAARARAAGWRGPILMLEGCFDAGDVEACRELGLMTVVHLESQLRMMRPVRCALRSSAGRSARASW